MKRLFRTVSVSVLLIAVVTAVALAQTLPELFAKAKAEVKAESWADALATLGRAGGRGSEARKRKRAEAARRPARLLPRRLFREPREVGRSRRELRGVSEAAARLHHRLGRLLEESRRGIRESPEAGGRARAFSGRGLQGIPAAGGRERPISRRPVLGRGSGALAHDRLGEGRVVGHHRAQRARHVRRGVLDGARGSRPAPTAGRTGRSSSAASPSRTRTSRSTPSSAAA